MKELKWLRDLLPKENPVCIHQWEMSPAGMFYICSTCGWRLSILDLCDTPEGPTVIDYTQGDHNDPN